MGSDYSGCFGSDRNKTGYNQGLLPTMMDTWTHTSRQKNVMVSAEEAYMMKKQQALQINFIPCQKLKNTFE